MIFIKKKIALISCLLLFISGCGTKNIVIKKDNGIDEISNINSKTLIDIYSSNIQYGNRHYISDFVSITDGELLNDKDIISYEDIGITDVKFNYLDSNKKKQEYTFKVNVVDTMKPIISADSKYYTYLGSDIDILSKIFCGDNYDRKLKCTLNGDYNINKLGTYKLSINAKDTYSNERTVNISLVVRKKGTSSGSSGTTSVQNNYDYFSDIVSSYKTDKTEIGIDVSGWQGEIDWQTVKNAGVEFAMIRMGYGYDSNGEFVFDKQFENNYKGAKENGIKIGIYFFSYATEIEEAKEHARWIIKVLNGDKIDLPIVFDWESWKSFDDYGINFLDINNIADAFNKEIIKAGYQAMQYGSKSKLESIWSLPEYPTWLAHYVKKTSYDKDFVMWQLTNNGKVDGIKEAVDIDILYK